MGNTQDHPSWTHLFVLRESDPGSQIPGETATLVAFPACDQLSWLFVGRGPASAGPGSPCTAKAQHLVFLASIFNEAGVSPQDKRNYRSRRDAEFKTGFYSASLCASASLRELVLVAAEGRVAQAGVPARPWVASADARGSPNALFRVWGAPSPYFAKSRTGQPTPQKSVAHLFQADLY